MNNETTKVTTKKTNSQRKTKPADAIEERVVEPKIRYVAKDIDPNQIVTVRNGFQGRLVYKSKKTGERFVWDGFNSEQDMEIAELRNARNSSKDFFINNWFMFDEPWVAEYLGVTQYYKFALTIDEFDKLFEKSTDEVAEIISMLSNGQKNSVAYRARMKIADGTIDSNKMITTLERCLGIELVEHDR